MGHIYTVAWGMTDEDAENIAVLENCAEQIIFCLPVNPDNVKEIQV
jgi:hypothetical protein